MWGVVAEVAAPRSRRRRQSRRRQELRAAHGGARLSATSEALWYPTVPRRPTRLPGWVSCWRHCLVVQAFSESRAISGGLRDISLSNHGRESLHVLHARPSRRGRLAHWVMARPLARFRPRQKAVRAPPSTPTARASRASPARASRHRQPTVRAPAWQRRAAPPSAIRLLDSSASSATVATARARR